jgi:hypothetical protein
MLADKKKLIQSIYSNKVYLQLEMENSKMLSNSL